MPVNTKPPILAAMILAGLGGQSAGAAATATIVLKNDAIEYALTAEGGNASFLVKGHGKEYLAGPGERVIVTLKQGGTSYSPTTCRFVERPTGHHVGPPVPRVVVDEGRLVAEFAAVRAVVTVKVRCARRYKCFEVESVDGPAVEEVSLLNLVLKTDRANAMSGVAADTENAVALRALNLQARGSVGGTPARLSATASRQHHLAGAKLGLAAAPVAEIRQVLRKMLDGEGELLNLQLTNPTRFWPTFDATSR